MFLIAGAFSMSAAIFASSILKQDEELRPAWARQRGGQVALLLAGNLAAVTLVAAMVYGVRHLTWWVPVVCLFLSFPIVHVVILDRLFPARVGIWLSGLGTLAGAGLIGVYW